MDDEIDIQDLDAYEIRELLLDQGSEVDEEQAAALKQFIEDIGGLENALAAVDMLDGLEKAACTGDCRHYPPRSFSTWRV